MMVRWLVVAAALLGFAGAAAGQSDQTAVVFGANGRLGAETVKALLANDIDVIAFVRPTSDRSLLEDLDVTYVEGDARNLADVERAMNAGKVTLVFNAIARRSRTETGLYDATQNNITESAKAANVRQIVFFSSVGAGDSRPLYSDEAYEMFRTVMEERTVAEDTLIGSGLTFTIIRTGGVLDEPAAGTGKGYLTENRIMGAITRPDLAREAVACVGSEKCANTIFYAADDTLKLPFE